MSVSVRPCLVCFAEDEREFDYIKGSEKGPSRWGKIKRGWELCGKGELQSPIDLWSHRVRVIPKLGQMYKRYIPQNATLKNRGHDIEVITNYYFITLTSLLWPSWISHALLINFSSKIELIGEQSCIQIWNLNVLRAGEMGGRCGLNPNQRLWFLSAPIPLAFPFRAYCQRQEVCLCLLLSSSLIFLILKLFKLKF